MVKDCVGKWLPCKYNTKGELISQWQTITPAQNNGNCKPEKDGGKKMCIQDCEYLHEYGKNLYDISLCTSDDKSQYRNIKKLKKFKQKELKMVEQYVMKEFLKKNLNVIKRILIIIHIVVQL